MKYEEEALNAAAELSKRYLTERFLPDTAIDLIDEAGARARLNNSNTPKHIKEIELEIEKLNNDKKYMRYLFTCVINAFYRE